MSGTLEVELPADKEITIVIFPKEKDDTPDGINCQDLQMTSFSKLAIETILPIIEIFKPDIVSIDMPGQGYKIFEKDLLYRGLKSPITRFSSTVIPEKVSSYLKAQIKQKRQESEQIKAQAEPLEDETKKKENFAEIPIRDRWIAEIIFDKARIIERRDILILHICEPSRLSQVSVLFAQLGIDPNQIWLTGLPKHNSRTTISLAKPLLC